MKYLSIVLLVIILSCQQKKSKNIESQNHTVESSSILGIDTIRSAENRQVSKSNALDTIEQKLPEQRKQNSVDADADFQQGANEKLTKLLKHYGENMPDYFGGGFIDDKGNLVINIKGNLKNGRIKVNNIIGRENVRFLSTKYSNKELIDIMDYLNEFAQNPENKKITSNLSGWSQMEDHIEVCFKKMDKNSEGDFRKYILNSEAIRFKECGQFNYN